jgi:hypothetical protein
MEKTISIFCDASGQGLGCVLMEDGTVVAYASWQLRKHELGVSCCGSRSQDFEVLPYGKEMYTLCGPYVFEVYLHTTRR